MKYFIFTFFLFFSFSLFAQTTVTPYPDNSFTTEQYMDLHIPSPQKKWGPEEMKAFIKYMEKIYMEDKWSLPRKDSPYSGVLFQKMVNLDNLYRINDKRIPIDERLALTDAQMEYSSFIIAIYKENNKATERFGSEVLATYAYLVYTSKSIRLFLDELKTVLPEENTQNSKFKTLYTNITEQLGDFMNMVLVTYEKESHRYDTQVLVDFAVTTRQLVTENWALLTPAQQTKLKATVKVLTQHRNMTIAAEMTTLYREL